MKHVLNQFKIQLSPFAHTVWLIATCVAAFLWVSNDQFNTYSLQIFSFNILSFFLIKRMKNAKIWHILPDPLSLETITLTFSILVLIGSTGNLSSYFFPLAYVHLFFITLVSHEITSIVVCLLVMTFHLLLPNNEHTNVVATIMTLPMLSMFFLFARNQYDEAHMQRELLLTEEKFIHNLAQSEKNIRASMSRQILPKVTSLQQLLTNTPVPLEVVNVILQNIKKELEHNIAETEKDIQASKTEEQLLDNQIKKFDNTMY